MNQPDGYVDPAYLEAAARLLAPEKHRAHALMRLQAGSRALDVGCGPATDTIALAQQVGEKGRVVGVDFDAAMVAAANASAAEAGVSARMHHLRASATALPFPTETFDACHSERLLLHIANYPRAFADMLRVTRRGGWLVCTETDWGTLSIDHPDADIERRLARFKAEQSVHNGFAGRRLYRLFRQAGLHAIEVFASAYPITDPELARYLVRLAYIEQRALAEGVITAAELDQWRAGLAEDFFCTLTLITVAGCKA